MIERDKSFHSSTAKQVGLALILSIFTLPWIISSCNSAQYPVLRAQVEKESYDGQHHENYELSVSLQRLNEAHPSLKCTGPDKSLYLDVSKSEKSFKLNFGTLFVESEYEFNGVEAGTVGHSHIHENKYKISMVADKYYATPSPSETVFSSEALSCDWR